jgi:beta-lactam-binding protein with PASTA domain
MTLAAAKRALKRAHCRVGKIKRVRSKQRAGRVLRQSRKPGARIREGARVALVITRH